MDEEDLQYFPEMIFYSLEGGFLIQERIDFSAAAPSDEAKKIVERLVQKYKLRDFTPGKRANWDIRKDGTPVIYDWGV
jgi:hypothetical protein